MANKMQVSTLQSSLEFFESQLFHDIQMAHLFSDSKTMADAVPKYSFDAAIDAYSLSKTQSDFDLRAFVSEHFELPPVNDTATLFSVDTDNTTAKDSAFESNISQYSISQYISQQWQNLTRPPDVQQDDTSLIALKHPYMVPGGRFREIYYWDSYFSALGLAVSGKFELIKSMMDNFIDIQQQIGLIPNGNRSYYKSRTQPPVLALMLELVLKHDDVVQISAQNPFFNRCLEAIETEYRMWMQGENSLAHSGASHRRVVRVGKFVLNRYRDDASIPRPESYREDVELAAGLTADRRPAFYRALRSACESGWDFSARWLQDERDLLSIHTTDILPVDLNALLHQVESALAGYFAHLGNTEKADDYQQRASNRADAIKTLFWNEADSWYFDFDFIKNRQTKVQSLAATVPLFVGIATPSQAKVVCDKLMAQFLKAGGLVTTLTHSGQQWDSPNGWAPLHYFACKGLENYGYQQASNKIKAAWLSSVEAQFNQHHSMLEKYDVVDTRAKAVGGEYSVQEGFGWTNGVSLQFIDDLKEA